MPGEVLGLVGKSGCGKSTVALGTMQDLGPAGRATAGRIWFRDRDLATLGPDALRVIRSREIAMIYQEPTASLNPALRVGEQLAEVPIRWDEIDWSAPPPVPDPQPAPAPAPAPAR